MRPVKTDSSYLVSLAYDERNHVLLARFVDGAVISYSGVPIRIYRAVILADSIGEKFTKLIKDEYPFKVIKKAA